MGVSEFGTSEKYQITQQYLVHHCLPNFFFKYIVLFL